MDSADEANDVGVEPSSEMNPLIAGSKDGYGGLDGGEGIEAGSTDHDGGWVLQDEMQMVFWFGSPVTFQVVLDVLMLLNCLYTALFIVYFLTLTP